MTHQDTVHGLGLGHTGGPATTPALDQSAAILAMVPASATRLFKSTDSYDPVKRDSGGKKGADAAAALDEGYGSVTPFFKRKMLEKGGRRRNGAWGIK